MSLVPLDLCSAALFTKSKIICAEVPQYFHASEQLNRPCRFMTRTFQGREGKPVEPVAIFWKEGCVSY